PQLYTVPILQRAGHINSAGGYLRSLTDKAAKGEHVRLVKGQAE
ncbi:replication initiation protein RepC, partial [Phyllobacterium myrsinacearum]|nr:hypothetical protein [Phyllobacterium myrsinacearum]